MIRALRVALCFLLAASLVGVVATTAAPPPRPLCDACGESFEATAQSKGLGVTVERSKATITVHENGSATWVVRNRLADSEDVERLRANARIRADVADRAMWDAEFLDATISSAGVLTMRYREPDFAEQSVAGVYYSGEFTDAYGYRNLHGLGADRLVVVAPDGTTVDRTVPGATVSDDGRRMVLTRFDDRGFVTFVPDDTAIGPALSVLALGTLLGPTIGTNLLVRVGFPTAVFGLLVGSVTLGLSRFDRGVARLGECAGVALAVSGGLAAGLALLAAGGVSLFGGAAAPLFGVGLTAAAFGALLSRPTVRERATYRRLVAGGALGVLVAAGSTLAGALAFGQSGLTRSLFGSFPPLVGVFALFPAGYALGRGDRRLALATATAGFALSILPFGSLVSPTPRFGLFGVVFVTLYAVIVTAAGTPLLVVGMSLGASPADGKTTPARHSR